MNRGINDQRDLPAEYLSKIYDEISVSEIKLKPTSAASLGSNKGSSANLQGELSPPSSRDPLLQSTITECVLYTASVTAKQKKAMFDAEMQHMTSIAKSLMESVSHAKIEFTSAKHHEHVRPMFKVCSSPGLFLFLVSSS